MSRDIGTLFVERLIVHDVPSRIVGGSSAEPTLSDEECELTPDLITFFRQKIVGSLVKRAFDVQFDPSVHSVVPDLVFDILGEQQRDFVDVSRVMATHLYGAQTGVNTSGLLVVVQTTIERVRSLAILKLEKETGARVYPAQTNGRTTFTIEQLRDLMLTTNTRVFKVGHFVQEGNNVTTIEGLVSDNQGGKQQSGGVADFFLRRFLGCRYRELPEVTTRRFFEATELFLNDVIEDPERKVSYQMALLVTLTSQYNTVTPSGFAESHFALEDRQPYLQALQRAQVPTEEFPKDLSQLSSRLQRLKFEFENGVVILAPPNSVERGGEVTVTDMGGSRARVVVEGQLTGLHSRR